MDDGHNTWNEGAELMGDKRIARWCLDYGIGTRIPNRGRGQLVQETGCQARQNVQDARPGTHWDDNPESMGDKRIGRWCRTMGAGNRVDRDEDDFLLDNSGRAARARGAGRQEHAVSDEVSELAGCRPITFGRHVAYWFERTPRRAVYYSSYYKFAAKMIGHNQRVLDVGCGEGLGTWLVAAECGFARGIDSDEDAIDVAKSNWPEEKAEFVCADFLAVPSEQWDAVVTFDVIEHIRPENAGCFLERIAANLTSRGIAVIGTPNQTGQVYASAVSKAGHVNVYSAERLEEELRRHFAHVFMFGANDEVVHTGFPPMAHYLIALGCKKLT
jgi:SAM-dependent methyltransferase